MWYDAAELHVWHFSQAALIDTSGRQHWLSMLGDWSVKLIDKALKWDCRLVLLCKEQPNLNSLWSSIHMSPIASHACTSVFICATVSRSILPRAAYLYPVPHIDLCPVARLRLHIWDEETSNSKGDRQPLTAIACYQYQQGKWHHILICAQLQVNGSWGNEIARSFLNVGPKQPFFFLHSLLKVQS